MDNIDLYDQTSNRLWEKLEYHKDKFKDFIVTFKEPTIDQLSIQYPFVLSLIQEVSEEFNYSMSEFQCSWAVNQTFGFPNESQAEKFSGFNEANGTDLRPRP